MSEQTTGRPQDIASRSDHSEGLLAQGRRDEHVAASVVLGEGDGRRHDPVEGHPRWHRGAWPGGPAPTTSRVTGKPPARSRAKASSRQLQSLAPIVPASHEQEPQRVAGRRERGRAGPPGTKVLVDTPFGMRVRSFFHAQLGIAARRARHGDGALVGGKRRAAEQRPRDLRAPRLVLGVHVERAHVGGPRREPERVVGQAAGRAARGRGRRRRSGTGRSAHTVQGGVRMRDPVGAAVGGDVDDAAEAVGRRARRAPRRRGPMTVTSSPRPPHLRRPRAGRGA